MSLAIFPITPLTPLIIPEGQARALNALSQLAKQVLVTGIFQNAPAFYKQLQAASIEYKSLQISLKPEDCDNPVFRQRVSCLRYQIQTSFLQYKELHATFIVLSNPNRFEQNPLVLNDLSDLIKKTLLTGAISQKEELSRKFSLLNFELRNALQQQIDEQDKFDNEIEHVLKALECKKELANKCETEILVYDTFSSSDTTTLSIKNCLIQAKESFINDLKQLSEKNNELQKHKKDTKQTMASKIQSIRNEIAAIETRVNSIKIIAESTMAALTRTKRNATVAFTAAPPLVAPFTAIPTPTSAPPMSGPMSASPFAPPINTSHITTPMPEQTKRPRLDSIAE